MTAKRLNACEVAVIGGGPYGLSVAAHLKHAGLSTRVFGEPMSFWRRHMPKGMRLRSPWHGTHISNPDGSLSLDAYARETSAERDKPLWLENFVAYGEWFQERAVPDIDRRAVRLIDGTSNGFQIELTDGEIFAADRVVMATGLANQDYRPRAFRDLPASLVTHACEHADFTPLRGKRVAVIGRGQSACESAALLAETGADVELISRDEIYWLGAGTHDALAQKTALDRLRKALAAPSAVGPFPLSWLAEFPAAVQHIPFEWRDWVTVRCLKAAAAGWLKPRLDIVKCNTGRTIVAARAVADEIVVELDSGPRTFDHVVLGTGYRIDLSRAGILASQLQSKIACADGSPLLRPGFESSVPKLHFVGSSAVKSFGPLLRFVAGAPFAARSVTQAALARRMPRAVAGFPPAFAPTASPPR